ncbi:DNA binding domain-containing protein, excisionase family [Streptomyces sp. 3213]|uniref:excisionase family DNA-binding protein n=1 Tax=Streptomyces sp. 3213.3 TaxID=1855348 RepID=UPI00089512F9|nr:excisionase family DNA-binding protein [Streptomyces sp. 3213.3]SED10557.1 DNA binding domain-containing protein, excisionase family [Streptomyces sp. 3213] [Streptomyces sp. 3213.3]
MDVAATAVSAQPRLHSVEAAAELLGIGRTATYDEIRLGRLRTVRRGRRRLVPTEWIDEYVELLKHEAEAAA